MKILNYSLVELILSLLGKRSENLILKIELPASNKIAKAELKASIS